MSNGDQFTSVWDALEDDPVRRENLKLRSALMMEIAGRLKYQGLTQTQAAELLHITQPRVSALLQGKIHDFMFRLMWPHEVAPRRTVAQIVPRYSVQWETWYRSCA
jgi:predicted XRE-type DNA-binding protein